MNKDLLIKYYNKFSEDKRLNSRHGQVEFKVAMHYLKKHIKNFEGVKILDVGAGTGKYSCALFDLGAEVTAVELVKYNLGVLKAKNKNISAIQGDARNLKKIGSESCDVVLLFGPMYHILSHEDRLLALREAKRVVKKGGMIFISYLMNDYAILTHGFRDGNIYESVKNGAVDESFQIKNQETDLYNYVRIEEMDVLMNESGLERIERVSQDGPTDYMRGVINKMTKEEFEVFVNYVVAISNRQEMIGCSSHVLDILKKPINE